MISANHRNVLRGILSLILLFALTLSSLAPIAQIQAAPAAGSIIHVNINAGTGGDGAAWGTAYKYLQDGLNSATSGDEIWVAAGVYYPDEDEGGNVTANDRDASFNLKEGVAIYGGFKGSETSRDQRDWEANLTVLSGDIDQNDTTPNGVLQTPDGIAGSNSRHVVRGDNLNNLNGQATVLDGFSITGGDADIELAYGGGGILLFRVNNVLLENLTVRGNRVVFVQYGGGGIQAYFGNDITIRHSTIRNNLSLGTGGGIVFDTVDGSTIEDSHILENVQIDQRKLTTGCVAQISGGGGLWTGGGKGLVLTDVVFEKNVADCVGGGFSSFKGGLTMRGGAFLNNRVRPTLRPKPQDISDGGAYFVANIRPVSFDNVLFMGNIAEREGGAIYVGPADLFVAKGSPTRITNSTFVANRTNEDMGAIGMTGFDEKVGNIFLPMSLENVIVWDNAGSLSKGIVGYIGRAKITVANSLVQDSNGSGASWNTKTGVDLGGNLDTVPGFRQPPVGTAPDVSGDFRLSLGSPAIDVGLNSAVTYPTDQAGNPRIFNTTVDMGAYETQVACPAGSTTRLYVDAHASGTGLGTSWTDALPSLQNALTLAQRCPSNSISEVWVAHGTYYPDDGTYQTDGDRAASFELKNGLAIYGGFVGNETDVNQRNPWSYITVLSGDINQDDNSDAHDLIETPNDIVGDNSYHVVVGSGTDVSAVLDGFALTGGQANGSPAAKQHEGGGFFAEAGSPTLNNLTLVGNIAQEGGAMTLVGGSNPAISNAWFAGNAASDYGGALHNESSSPSLTNVLLSGNRAAAGGGAIYNLASSPELTNVTIAGNAAGGTVSLAAVNSAAVEIAPVGGGILNLTGSKPDIRNSIIWANQDSSGVGTASSSIRNLDIGSTPSVDYSDIQGLAGITGLLYDGTSIDLDPLFVSPVNPASAPSFGGDYRLKTGSPAIDTGSNGFNALPTDLAQQPRIQDGNGDNTATIDMGAYEAPLLLVTAIEVVKTASTQSAAVGSAITYTYAVTNTGNVTVTLTADDDKLGPISFSPSVLAPAGVAGATAGATATAADLPQLVNTIHVTGTAAGGSEAHAADTARVDLQASTEMAVTKTASAASIEVGETIIYTYKVENIGVDTLEDISAYDDKLGPVSLPVSLTTGTSAQSTLAYVVQESDLPILVNNVTVTATVGVTTEVEHDGASVKVTSMPGLALHKSVDAATAKVGDMVTYRYEIINTGDVSLKNLALSDSELGPIAPLPATTLSAGDAFTVTQTYTVTEGDLPGPLTNTATATGEAPTGAVQKATDSASVSLSYRPRIAVEKSASPSSALPGETITYSYEVKNMGDVSLSAVTATDDLLGAVTLSATTLAPGASATGTLTYTVKTSDLPGPLTNVVETEGTSPVGTVVKDQDSATIVIIEPIPPAELYLPLILKQ